MSAPRLQRKLAAVRAADVAGFSRLMERPLLRRREFLNIVGGTFAAWPCAAGAQQPERMRLIGVMMNTAADDPESQRRLGAFQKELKRLGWDDGRNVRFEYRWAVGDAERHRVNAAELVARAPDVILAHGSLNVRPLLRATESIPVVFVSVIDPVSNGFVESLARPGGNATGLVLFEYGLAGKWLELLRQMAPYVKRVAVIRDPSQVSGGGQLGALQAVAQVFGMELTPINARDRAGIERALTSFARQPNGGMIVTATALVLLHRRLIIDLAARHKLPSVYAYRLMVEDGGLVSYGPDTLDQYRHAATYVDRILRGAKPGDLPVQQPTKVDLVINLKTAKALGIDVPQELLARADEVIE